MRLNFDLILPFIWRTHQILVVNNFFLLLSKEIFFFCVSFSTSRKSFFARVYESKPASSKDQSEQHTVFTLVKAEMRQTFYRHTRRVEESKVMPKKNPGDFSFWHIWCLYCILMYKNRTSFTIKHTVWKLLKMSHLIFLILAFSLFKLTCLVTLFDRKL